MNEVLLLIGMQFSIIISLAMLALVYFLVTISMVAWGAVIMAKNGVRYFQNTYRTYRHTRLIPPQHNLQPKL